MLSTNNIRKSEFFQNFLKMFTATTLSQIIGIVGSILLAKFYIPDQFGVFSLFMSILMFLVVLSTLRYESAIIIEKNIGVVGMLINTLFVYIFMFSSFIFLLLVSVPTSILSYYEIDGFFLYIPFGVFAYGLYNTLISIYVRHKNFNMIAKIKISIAVFVLIFQISFFFLEIENGLIMGFSLGYFIISLYMFITLKEKIVIQSKKRIILVLKKYFYLVKYGLPTQVVDTMSNAVLPILIIKWFNLELAGIYFFAYKLTNLPLQLIGVSVGKVFYQKASHLYNYNNKHLSTFVLKIIGLTSVIVFLPLVILFFFSKVIISFLVGETWIEAGTYISILVFMLFFRTISSAISPLADILNKLNVIFVFSVFLFLTNIGAMYIGYLYDDFELAIWILSAISAFLYLLIIIYFVIILKLKKY